MLLGAIGALLILDQFTKVLAQHLLKGAGTISYAGDTFRFTYAENTGVFLGLGSRLPEPVRFWLFTLMVGAILAFILFDTLRRDTLDRQRLMAVTLILAGGFGNLIDRVIRGGVVVDFMNMGIGRLRTGIFNVADILITTGALAFVVIEFFASRSAETTEVAEVEQHG